MRRVIVSALLAGLLAPSPALAYKWFYNEDNKPLHQFKQMVLYVIDDGSLDTIEDGKEDEIIKTAFAVWSGLDSPLEFVYAGHAANATAEFLGDPELDENQVVFIRDAWNLQVPFAHENARALTTLSYSLVTGEIFDADIRLNNDLYFYADCSNAPDDFFDYQDLFYIVLHESGHMLGLDHSGDTLSVMFVQDSTCDDDPLHTLTPDDEEGFNSYYGTDEYLDRCCAVVAEPDPDLESDLEIVGQSDQIGPDGSAETVGDGAEDDGKVTPDCGCRTGGRPGWPAGGLVLFVLSALFVLALRQQVFRQLEQGRRRNR